MGTRIPFGLALSLSPLALLPAPAARSCATPSPPLRYVCADASAEAQLRGVLGSTATSNGVAYLNQIGGPADMIATAEGLMHAEAFVDVGWGVVRVHAGADNGSWAIPDPGFAESRTLAIAQGAFADVATLVSPTLPAGTPVEITAGVDAAGGVAPTGGTIDLDLTLSKLGHIGFFQRKVGRIHNTSGPPMPPPFALEGYFVGDQIAFTLLFDAVAHTSNRFNPHPTAASLESGRVWFQIHTPDVTLASESGYDYTTRVPEPGPELSLAAAAAAVLGLARARSARAGRL